MTRETKVYADSAQTPNLTTQLLECNLHTSDSSARAGRRKQISRLSGFTLIEVLVVIIIISILAAITYAIINPANRLEASQQSQALTELREIGKALGFFSLDNGYYPADVARDVLPTGLGTYLSAQNVWPSGPFPGSVYDYDNWAGLSCVDPAANDTIQVTLRNVPGRNPDGSNAWAWYYVLQGKGTPHCTDANEATKGECVNCPGFVL